MGTATATAPAMALDKAACVASSDLGQKLRDRAKLKAARAEFLKCADTSCPDAVRSACAGWIDEVDAAMPSVILGASTPRTSCANARDLVDVRVTLDGAPLADRLDGRALSVEPGEHSFRFESGGASAEEKVLVKQGEKSRPVAVTLELPTTPCPGEAGEHDAPPDTRTNRGAPAAAWITGGLAVAALGTFGGFALAGHLEYEDYASSCGHRCTQDQADSVNTKFIVADVALGVGIASAVIATVLFALPRGHRTTALSAGGLALSW